MPKPENDPDTTSIQTLDGGAVRIGGSCRLADIASSAPLRASYPLLAAACEYDLSTTNDPATLAELLAPATACARAGDGVRCALSASATCAMREPGSDLHAIMGGGPCWNAWCPATAVALVALDAELEIATPEGTDWSPANEYFALVDGAMGSEPPRAVMAVRLGADSAGGLQIFTRPAEDVNGPLRICLAATRRTDGDVRLVLGGVSPRPYRVYSSVEEEAMAGGLDDETIAGLAERALLDAEIDVRSAGSVDRASELLRQAIRAIDSLSGA